MDRTDLQIFRGMPFFAALAEESIIGLIKQCNRSMFQSGQIIIGHDERTCDVLFLMSGQARVNIYSASGRRVSFRDMSKGAIFGELSAIDGQPRSASVEAVTSCSAAIMPRGAFIRSLEEQPEFMLAVMRHLTQQVRRLTERVFEFSTLAVRNRVQAELLRMAGQDNSNVAVISPAPTHEEIASRISTHREAVTRELSRLDAMGLVTKQGRALHITDLRTLRRLVEYVSDD
jgi:CRP-like cAMP-binding protein